KLPPRRSRVNPIGAVWILDRAPILSVRRMEVQPGDSGFSWTFVLNYSEKCSGGASDWRASSSHKLSIAMIDARLDRFAQRGRLFSFTPGFSRVIGNQENRKPFKRFPVLALARSSPG